MGCMFIVLIVSKHLRKPPKNSIWRHNIKLLLSCYYNESCLLCRVYILWLNGELNKLFIIHGNNIWVYKCTVTMCFLLYFINMIMLQYSQFKIMFASLNELYKWSDDLWCFLLMTEILRWKMYQKKKKIMYSNHNEQI